MKKGFTLVEVVSVLILLAVIGLIVFPTVSSIIKKGEEDLYNEQLERIKEASEKWAYDNIDKLPSDENDLPIKITLLDLKKSGYLPIDIKDPRTDEAMPNELVIIIAYVDNEYTYTIPEINIDTEGGPKITVRGEAVEYVDINAEYIEPGATAISSVYVVPVTITYFENGKQVARIKTDKPTTYTVEYRATHGGKTSVVTRTVIVRNDTEAPKLTIDPIQITISQSEAENFNLLQGVIATDNSNEEVNIEVSDFNKNIGENTITYKACDNSGNCIEANRIITVE